MARDFTLSAMLRARADHDAAQRREQIAAIRIAPKPKPQTLMSFEHAELLAEVHDYADGEEIGCLDVGGAYQTLTYSHGQVVADPQAGPRRRRTSRRNPVSWSSQSERQIQGSEKV
jgi:hypothetical protein